jgi:hypothetical protein
MKPKSPKLIPVHNFEFYAKFQNDETRVKQNHQRMHTPFLFKMARAPWVSWGIGFQNVLWREHAKQKCKIYHMGFVGGIYIFDRLY